MLDDMLILAAPCGFPSPSCRTKTEQNNAAKPTLTDRDKNSVPNRQQTREKESCRHETDWEREGERARERETERQRDRETERQTHTHTQARTNRHAYTDRQIIERERQKS